MSLSVYLTGKTESVQCVCTQCGHKHTRKKTEEWFSASITHNLVPMARKAGIYKPLWYPEKIGISKAGELIGPLRKALALMKATPSRFKKYNAKNEWGLYENFVPWMERYLAACEEHHDTNVKVSR